MRILQIIGGFALGVIVAWIVISLGQLITGQIWPFPDDIDLSSRSPETLAQLAAFVQSLPPTAGLINIAGYILGVAAGGVVAGMLSRSFMAMGVTLGLFFTLMALVTAFGLPVAIWIKVAMVSVQLPAAVLGTRIGSNLAR